MYCSKKTNLYYLSEHVSIHIVRQSTANPGRFSPSQLSEMTNHLGSALGICSDVGCSGVIDLHIKIMITTGALFMLSVLQLSSCYLIIPQLDHVLQAH